MGLTASIRAFILLIIVDVFALSLTGTIADAVVQATSSANVTGASASILPLVTLVYVVCIIGANVGVLYRLFRG